MEIRDKIKQIKYSRLKYHEKYLSDILEKTTEKSKKLFNFKNDVISYTFNGNTVFVYKRSKKEFLFDSDIVWYPILDGEYQGRISGRELFDYIINTLRGHFKLSPDVYITNERLS